MICPNCKCEYIRGVTECADCGVPLVDALNPSQAMIAQDEHLVAAWRGTDPAEQERVEEVLVSAGIPFTAPDTKSSFSFIPTEPTMEVWVSEADQEKARKLIDQLDDRAHPDELTPEEAESLAIPESNDADGESDDDEQAELHSDLSKHWYDDDPVADVWNGDSEAFADNLIACLREVGIASRKLPEADRWRLVVRPEQEPRAKEIVREVVEATPPD